MVASGALVHTTDLVARERLQSTGTRASPLQRRADLATLRLDVAGQSSAPSLYDVDAGDASELRLRLTARFAGG